LFKKVYEEEIDSKKDQQYDNEILSDSSYLSKHRVSNWMKERKKLFNYFLPFLFTLSFLKYGHLITLRWIKNSFLENERNESKLISMGVNENENENEANQCEVYKYSFINWSMNMDPNMSVSEFHRLSCSTSFNFTANTDINTISGNNENEQDHSFSKKYEVNIIDSIITEFKGFL
jgi:hypothetical protein